MTTASRSRARRSTSSAVPVLDLGLAALSRREAQPAGADLRVEIVLDRVDVVGTGTRLRPEIARVGRRAAELEADEVVLLVGMRAAALAVRAHLPELELTRVARGRPDRPCPARDADRPADRRLGHVGVE